MYVLILAMAVPARSQQANVSYSLEDLLSLAEKGSARAEQYRVGQKIAAVQYNLFRRANLPLILFSGNVPMYNKDNFAVIQPNGTQVFRRRSQSNSDASFSVEQAFPQTNATISLNTYLNRFDDYYAKSKSYNSTLVYIQLNQPIFSFNKYKWDRRIEPLRYKESQLLAATASYELSSLVCGYYYDVIEAEADLQLASTNLSYATANKATEQRKKELGASTEDKLLQLQMMELEAAAGVKEAQSRVATTKSGLKNFLGMQDADLSLRAPLPGSTPSVSLQDLMSSAKRTHPLFLSAGRALLEAQSITDQARADGREINIVGSFGLTNTGGNLSALLANPNDQQRFRIGLQIPIYDGGRHRQKLLIAQENERLVAARTREDVLLLVNDITDIYNEYSYIIGNIDKFRLMDSLGQQRFSISNRLFSAGKISVTEVQTAQREKDSARRNYLRMIRRLAELKYAIRAKAGMPIE